MSHEHHEHSRRMPDLGPLTTALRYDYQNQSLLTEALSHRSAGSTNYERLEFLGDGLLNFVIAAALYRMHPELNEGSLSRLRASLVRESTLADIARDLKLSEYLYMGQGELRSGGFNRDSILSDVVESLIGACYMEAGFDTAEALVLRLFDSRLHNLPEVTSLKDPKTQLQEWLQGQQLERPVYEVVGKEGKAHELQFTVTCAVASSEKTVRATASSRRKAEQTAAAEMLELLKSDIG